MAAPTSAPAAEVTPTAEFAAALRAAPAPARARPRLDTAAFATATGPFPAA